MRLFVLALILGALSGCGGGDGYDRMFDQTCIAGVCGREAYAACEGQAARLAADPSYDVGLMLDDPRQYKYLLQCYHEIWRLED